ncbi:hypothetical protein [Roseomonas fluvialis]|uniref:DUF883 domain-containing protein n=1 Tax=Roseomonas fluvialis TaxID=1750527 RepID=A0ABM7Y9Q1_9PROT|nr:hypothetical protein [Roseomonas fluvialis]BDG74802.1 hypothetical protein Rmf_47310 [Roseomonas fluvialis]
MNNANRTQGIGETAAGMAQDAKDAASAELAVLREKVEALMRDRVTPALADAAGRAEDAAHDAMDAVRRQTGNFAATVRDQPIAAVGAAALAGIAIGLLLRR